MFELPQSGGAGTLARQMREVRVEDVLGREPVQMELERVGAYLAGETVLVTGAGGSIGSELCRQIARVEPHRIVLVDHAEDNLFQIQRELLRFDIELWVVDGHIAQEIDTVHALWMGGVADDVYEAALRPGCIHAIRLSLERKVEVALAQDSGNRCSRIERN